MALPFVENKSRFVQMLGKTLELVILSVGLISTLAVMKDSVLPYSCHLLFSTLMALLTCIRCFLSSPPTLILLLINLIVLLIFASSAFYARRNAHHHHHITTRLEDVDLHLHHESPLAPQSVPPRDVIEVTTPPPPLPRNVIEVTPPPPPPPRTRNNLALIPQPHEIKTTPSSSGSTEDKWKDVFIQNDEKATENEDDTMEATWKAITGGEEQKPKKKHLRKSETWDAPPPPRRSFAVHRLDSEEVLPTSPKWKELRKAETFNDAVSVMRRGGMIRRGPSMSLEEFNQKVEAFIENFNNNMRLQRQESHQRFLEKINHKQASSSCVSSSND